MMDDILTVQSGFAGICIYLVYWITRKLNGQLEELKAEIQKLNENIQEFNENLKICFFNR